MPREKIAIIGTGIAGLSAAWLLSNDHEIHIFERAAKPGMGIYSLDVNQADKTLRVDIPLRVFTPAYYPHLLKLYAQAGIATEITNHAAAFADEHNQVFFHYGNTLIGKKNLSYPKPINWLKEKRWLRLWEHQRFFATLRRCAKQPPPADMSFGDFIAREQLDTPYLRRILLPSMATVCTCDYGDVLNYPAAIMLAYLNCGVMQTGVMRAVEGVDGVLQALLEPRIQLHTSAHIQRVIPLAGGAEIEWQHGQREHFDRVIIATQPHQAAALLPAEHAWQNALQAIPVRESRMLLHTQGDLLPDTQGLSPVSYFLPEAGQRPETCVDLSKAIHQFAGCQPVFQVWNPVREVAPQHLLADVRFSRPVVTCASRKASQYLREAQQASNPVMLSGSYLCDGIPLLDGAVEASLALARQLKSSRAW